MNKEKKIGLNHDLAKAMKEWDLPTDPGNEEEFEAFRARLNAHINATVPWWRRVWFNLRRIK